MNGTRKSYNDEFKKQMIKFTKQADYTGFLPCPFHFIRNQPEFNQVTLLIPEEWNILGGYVHREMIHYLGINSGEYSC